MESTYNLDITHLYSHILIAISRERLGHVLCFNWLTYKAFSTFSMGNLYCVDNPQERIYQNFM